MKKIKLMSSIWAVIFVFAFASCTQTPTETEENSPIETNESAEEGTTASTDPLAADALRMGELACASKAIMNAFQAKNISKEEMDEQVAPLNAEMTTISKRFENEYKNDEEKLKRFQSLFESVFPACN